MKKSLVILTAGLILASGLTIAAEQSDAKNPMTKSVHKWVAEPNKPYVIDNESQYRQTVEITISSDSPYTGVPGGSINIKGCSTKEMTKAPNTTVLCTMEAGQAIILTALERVASGE